MFTDLSVDEKTVATDLYRRIFLPIPTDNPVSHNSTCQPSNKSQQQPPVSVGQNICHSEYSMYRFIINQPHQTNDIATRVKVILFGNELSTLSVISIPNTNLDEPLCVLEVGPMFLFIL